MPKRPQIELTKEELSRAEIPTNHVLVKMVFKAEGAKSKGGLIIGFLTDDVYAEGDDSHSANLAEVYGIVEKVPQKLYYNPDDPKSMDWDCDMELQVGDMVWYSMLEAKNSVQILCEGVTYKSIPYYDCYVAKRRQQLWQMMHPLEFALHYKGDNPEATAKKEFEYVIVLNGYALLKPCYLPKLSHLDTISDTQIDMTRGIVAFVGKPVRAYKNESYSHIEDLQVRDEVLFNKNTPLFMLERSKALCTFDGDNQYWVVARRRIACIINRK